MTKRRKKISIGIVVALVALGALLVGLGYFPVARVAGSTITYRDLNKMVKSSELVRQGLLKTDLADTLASVDVDTEKAVFEELIIQDIVNGAIDEFDRPGIESEVAKRMKEVEQKVDLTTLNKNIKQFYGLSYAEFRRYTIEPQLKEIMLREKVEATGKEYGAWLEERAKNTNVSIYFLSYEWRDGHLEKK